MLVANSEFTADGVRAVTTRGDLRVVYNPVNLARFDRSCLDRALVRNQLGLPDATFLLAVIGQITPWKGQLDAIRAFALAREALGNSHLLVVGETKFVSAATDNREYYAEITSFIRSEGLADCVHLLGERSDIPDIMGSLDVLLVPSWEEPFGRVVVEAMALGIPVLATSVGGPAEIIRNDLDGLLLAPRTPAQWAQAIRKLAGSSALRAEMGKAAVQRAEEFRLPVHVRAIRDIYEELLCAI